MTQRALGLGTRGFYDVASPRSPAGTTPPTWDSRQCSSSLRETDLTTTSAGWSNSKTSCRYHNEGLTTSPSVHIYRSRSSTRNFEQRKQPSMMPESFPEVASTSQHGLSSFEADWGSNLAPSCSLVRMKHSVSSGSDLFRCPKPPQWKIKRRNCLNLISVQLKDDESESAQRNSSSASLTTSGSSVKFNRLEPTFPLSSSASSLKTSVRVLYSLATHGGLIAFGCLICQLTGTNVMGMIHLDSLDAVRGLLLAVPPILLSSFLQLEFLVQSWEVARGMRDAEDEELLEYYVGMTPSQFIPVAVASAISQEVFFRAALQGGLALAFHLGGTAGLEGTLLQDLGAPAAVGMAAVSGYFPAFAPFSQLHAAVVMAAMTGSFDYATSKRSVPTVIVTDGRNLPTLKNIYGEWYQRQQLKGIYAPMFTAMLALYFGLEWILVGNLLAPIVTHSLYLAWSMMFGLARLDRTSK